MKHSVFFEEIVSCVDKNHRSFFSVDSFSVVPFFLSLIKKRKKIVSVDPLYFDEYYSFFPPEKNVLGVPCVPYKSPFSFVSFHDCLLRTSINKISSDWTNFDICVVDKSVLKKPLFPLKRGSLISSKDSIFSYDALLSFLQKNNYKRVDFLTSEGEFVLRGSIVDVFSFGEKKPVRINFFDIPFKCYLINLSSGLTLKQLDKVSVLPFFYSGSLSLFDLMDNTCLLVSYKKEVLSITNPAVRAGVDFFYKKPFNSFDYQGFSVFKKDNTSFLSSTWLSSSGVFFNDKVVCPRWFIEDENVLLPVSSSDDVELIEGDYYIHSGFGVCCFLGFEEQVLSQDRLCFSFLDGVLKIDIKYLNLISYYSSRGFGEKKLNSLNKTKSWENKKKKVSSSAEKYVKNIVNK